MGACNLPSEPAEEENSSPCGLWPGYLMSFLVVKGALGSQYVKFDLVLLEIEIENNILI